MQLFLYYSKRTCTLVLRNKV